MCILLLRSKPSVRKDESGSLQWRQGISHLHPAWNLEIERIAVPPLIRSKTRFLRDFVKRGCNDTTICDGELLTNDYIAGEPQQHDGFPLLPIHGSPPAKLGTSHIPITDCIS